MDTYTLSTYSVDSYTLGTRSDGVIYTEKLIFKKSLPYHTGRLPADTSCGLLSSLPLEPVLTARETLSLPAACPCCGNWLRGSDLSCKEAEEQRTVLQTQSKKEGKSGSLPVSGPVL